MAKLSAARIETAFASAPRRAALHEIAARARGKGKRGRLSRGGTKVLFAGRDGASRALAAQALANELGVELFRVDLAQVASKYVGETEKRLARAFDAAERSGAVLFFDEADSLFGKRTGVKDSHDRYANIETAYLLKRLESYDGLAILATNSRTGIDAAFLRRMHTVVRFPRPRAK